jgi:hypothetical protein
LDPFFTSYNFPAVLPGPVVLKRGNKQLVVQEKGEFCILSKKVIEGSGQTPEYSIKRNE